MKKEKRIVHAIPSKRLYQSIIADYDIDLAICELIDNALDIWTKENRLKKLKIVLEFDIDQQIIKVSDNAGGIAEENIKNIIAPGFTSNTSTDETIGVFGVGSKRAVVALAQEIKILTRYVNEKTFLIEYNDDWLQEEVWNLEYYTYTKNIPEASTIIELNKLRATIDQKIVDQLENHLRATYAKFLAISNLSIIINDKDLKPILFDESWSYPPNYEPQKFVYEIPIKDEKSLRVEMLGGLVGKDQVGEGQYGVYFYCNERLILKADKSYDFGFTIGQAGLPHPQLNPMRVLVYLNGNPERMPWNSSKSGINFKNRIFQLLRPKILQLVTYYAKLARKLVGNIDETIYKYDEGEIQESVIEDISKPIKLHSLPSPEKLKDFAQQVIELNKKLSDKKPWIIGLYEGVIIVDNIIHTHFTQKNRYGLIMLDSTLEIAFKEYLVHDAKT